MDDPELLAYIDAKVKENLQIYLVHQVEQLDTALELLIDVRRDVDGLQSAMQQLQGDHSRTKDKIGSMNRRQIVTALKSDLKMNLLESEEVDGYIDESSEQFSEHRLLLKKIVSKELLHEIETEHNLVDEKDDINRTLKINVKPNIIETILQEDLQSKEPVQSNVSFKESYTKFASNLAISTAKSVIPTSIYQIMDHTLMAALYKNLEKGKPRINDDTYIGRAMQARKKDWERRNSQNDFTQTIHQIELEVENTEPFVTEVKHSHDVEANVISYQIANDSQSNSELTDVNSNFKSEPTQPACSAIIENSLSNQTERPITAEHQYESLKTVAGKENSFIKVAVNTVSSAAEAILPLQVQQILTYALVNVSKEKNSAHRNFESVNTKKPVKHDHFPYLGRAMKARQNECKRRNPQMKLDEDTNEKLPDYDEPSFAQEGIPLNHPPKEYLIPNYMMTTDLLAMAKEYAPLPFHNMIDYAVFELVNNSKIKREAALKIKQCLKEKRERKDKHECGDKVNQKQSVKASPNILKYYINFATGFALTAARAVLPCQISQMMEYALVSVCEE
ncbi:hypothetical protein BCR33DRAFT_717288 [Rhizoclosmatium globosum]|uniref:Uncharacterized protein n=1 Tax=Rhizoclosmatium globosum TaxID=329046 RepID=A0A1Y2C9I1_9FUNG|nr:hypothetical protein BCR33DRAFT_717288 [Rhizoclosmatium globosum]|eukprot:ORY43596.1 hypothetical protein BCR33DRAFT_717288 [Rhizoclosmatium globosum]